MSFEQPECDFTIVQGTTWDVDLELFEDDGTPTDLTGVSFSLLASHSQTGETWSIGASEITTTAPGVARILVGSDVTAGLLSGDWKYDLFDDRTGVNADGRTLTGRLRVVRTLRGTR